MNITEAIALLENSSARNFSSRKALQDACDTVAGKIIDSLPEGTVELPRGYRKLDKDHYFANTLYTSRAIVKSVEEYDDYRPYTTDYAMNNSAYLVRDNPFVDAPRKMLLSFAKDCATGLLEEIAAQLAKYADENESVVQTLEEAA